MKFLRENIGAIVFLVVLMFFTGRVCRSGMTIDKLSKQIGAYEEMIRGLESAQAEALAVVSSLESSNRELIKQADATHAVVSSLKKSIAENNRLVADVERAEDEAITIEEKYTLSVQARDILRGNITFLWGVVKAQTERADAFEKAYYNEVIISTEWKKSYEREHTARLHSEAINLAFNKRLNRLSLEIKIVSGVAIGVTAVAGYLFIRNQYGRSN